MKARTPSELYIKKVKSLFPYVGKNEKNYLNNLRLTLDEYCSSENISSLSDLEDGFGKAADVVHDYYYSIDTDVLIKQLNLRKIIRIAALIIIIIVAVVAIFFAIYIYKEYQLLKQTSIYLEEIIIE